MKIQFIAAFFQENGGIVQAKKLRDQGFTHYQLNQLIHRGQVVKVKQGLYKWNDSNQSELLEVARIVPNGIFCLFTACQQYELTTFVSSSYHIAVPRASKVILPPYPPIKLYYWDSASFHTGKIEIDLDGAIVHIYDVEKTVCDVIRQRNKIGMDITKEVIKSYLERKERNLSRLMEYARILRLEKYMSTYLNLLV
jgi:predicted transcriptional regulator of viral defense system